MLDNDGQLDLTVSLGADEWGYARRRLRYLEACLVQVLRDKAAIKEWWTAAELATIGLPGIPATKAGITGAARARGWMRRRATGNGGSRFEYHFASLPARAFDALIARVVQLDPPDDARPGRTAPEVPMEFLGGTPSTEPPTDASTPPWALPLLRVLKQERPATVDGALAALERSLPADVGLPSRAEAEAYLRRLGALADA